MKCLGNVETIGLAWITMLNEIIQNGTETLYTDNADESYPVKEVVGRVLTIQNMSLPDPIIEKYMVPEEFVWMEDNFTKLGTVKELYHENSYASRFYCYMNEKNQMEWVITRLQENLHARSATITTFEPLTDEKYIPCVSMLDFYVESDKLDLYVYCRSLDFGCKAYVNLVMLYKIMKQIADKINIAVGAMHLIVKSAHVYDRDKQKIERILSDYSKNS